MLKLCFYEDRSFYKLWPAFSTFMFLSGNEKAFYQQHRVQVELHFICWGHNRLSNFLLSSQLSPIPLQEHR